MTPAHATTRSAGADLHAVETVTLEPQEVRLIGTGFSLPDVLQNGFEQNGFEQHGSDLVFMLCNRSSVAYKKSLMILNGVGVIDQDYKDEIKVMYMNMGGVKQTINKGERIAQLVPMRYVPFVFDVNNNERNGGFGSTNEQ